MSGQTKSAVISATFTADTLREDLEFLFAKAGLELDLRFCPYNQVFQELLSENSLSATNSNGLNIILVRAEDFLRDISPSDNVIGILEKAVADLRTSLKTYTERAKVPTLLVIFSPSPDSRHNPVALGNATSGLLSYASSLPGMVTLTTEEIDAVSDGERYDSTSNELAHIPFTEQYFAAIALALSRKTHALLKAPSKVLVLDCDNTLWRGVVGEDGIDGITLAPAFDAVQRFAVNLHSLGVLICLVSKNIERDVLDVFEQRKDMILTIDQVVDHRINWISKPQNIASLAQGLNLGLDAFVFIDDNPVECEQMRAELPQVLTFQLPQEDQVASFLSNLWVFDKVSVTEEDKRRTQMYKENAERQQLEVSTVDIRDFIKSLNVVTDISRPREGDWPRLAQLTQRTNQFNFTTQRQSESELRALEKAGHQVFSVRVKDRFGDYGLVGLMVTHVEPTKCVVDNFLLSCRVLGRGVEHTILRHLGAIATDNRCETVELICLSTAKNEPARAFIDSVASPFKAQTADGALYRIPAFEACSIAHRPGEDPDAVIAASKSSEGNVRSKNVAATTVAPSDRYLELAQVLTTGTSVRQALKAAFSAERTISAAAVPPSTELQRRMLSIWKDVLSINDLGIEDDYFSLGGSSLLAARLFSEIRRQLRVRLPLTTILEYPTVRSLCRRVEQLDQPHSSLIELKTGLSRKLFLVHDGDGETLLYVNLSRRLPNDTAVFGIEPKTIPNIPLAHASIEDMAAWYLDIVKKAQPEGPYLLGGMCAGGVIAYEMASQLKSAGEDVELLVLLDAAAPRAPKRVGRIAKRRFDRLASALADEEGPHRSRIRRLAHTIEVVIGKLWNAARWEVVSRFKAWSTRARFKFLQFLLNHGRQWPTTVPSLTIREIYDSFENAFQPKPLFGVKVLLVRASSGEFADTPYREIYSDHSLGWGTLASNLTIADVEGGHSSMLQEPFVKSLAEALRHLLVEEPILDSSAPNRITETA